MRALGGVTAASGGEAFSLLSGSVVGWGGRRTSGNEAVEEPPGTGAVEETRGTGRSKNLGIRGGCSTWVYEAVPRLGCTGQAWRVRPGPRASPPPIACPAGHRHGRPAPRAALPLHAISQRPLPPTGAHRGRWQGMGVLIGPVDAPLGRFCAGSTRNPPACGRLQQRLVGGPAAPGGPIPPAVARGPVGPAGWLGRAGSPSGEHRGASPITVGRCFPPLPFILTATMPVRAQRQRTAYVYAK